MKRKKSRKVHNQGFSLIELVVVMAIMAIILSIAAPLYNGYIDRATKHVCKSNCLQLEQMYHAYLVMEKKEHTANVFKEFVQNHEGNMCPANEDIKYEHGMVKCILHSVDEANGNDGDEGDGSIPYL